LIHKTEKYSESCMWECSRD